MNEIKLTVAHNLTELRKAKKITQGELAEKFSYSDKSVSKWEHGDALPDIEVLNNLCKFYGVTLDYLVNEHEVIRPNQSQLVDEKVEKTKHIIITCLFMSIVWIAATIVFVSILIYSNISYIYWMAFIWAIPISALVCAIFNGIWGKKVFTFAISSIFVWSLILSFYLEILTQSNFELNLWMLFLIGIPIQASIILWSSLKEVRSKR